MKIGERGECINTCMISRTRYSRSGARATATSEDKLVMPMLCAITSIVSFGTELISLSIFTSYWIKETCSGNKGHSNYSQHRSGIEIQVFYDRNNQHLLIARFSHEWKSEVNLPRMLRLFCFIYSTSSSGFSHVETRLSHYDYESLWGSGLSQFIIQFH